MCSGKERYYAFRSDDASAVTNEGASYRVNFGPKDPSWDDVKKVKISAVRATIWFTMPNLQSTTMTIVFELPASGTGAALLTTTQVVVSIPKGLYGYDTLNSLIAQALQRANIPTNQFSIHADFATQKIQFLFRRPGYVQLGSRELASMFGFALPEASALTPTDTALSQQIVDADDFTASPWTDVAKKYYGLIPGWTSTASFLTRVKAPYHARFDRIQYLNVFCDLVNGGFYGNGGRAMGCIAQVLIDRAPGEQIVYDPTTVIQHDTSAFGQGRWPDGAVFTLMDDKFRTVDTNGQTWTITVKVAQVE